MLSYYSFERKMIKWWKKLYLHLYYLAVVSAHILHTKTNKKDFTGNFLQKKLPKVCWLVPVQKCKYKFRLSVQQVDLYEEIYIYIYRIPATYAKLEGISQCSCRVWAEKSARLGKLWRMHYIIQLKIWFRTLYRAVFCSVSHKTDILGTTVTFVFGGSATKTISVSNM